MISKERNLLFLIPFLFISGYNSRPSDDYPDAHDPVSPTLIKTRIPTFPFCSPKQFDSVFNMGHIIYFYRCGQMWAFDPKLNQGDGLLIHDSSILPVVTNICNKDTPIIDGRLDMKFCAFSFQDITCIKEEENSINKCKRAVREWNHLTFIICREWVHVFELDTTFEPKYHGALPFSYSQSEPILWYKLNHFFPYLTKVAPDLSFNETKMEIKFMLFDPFHQYLYLAIKHELYYCVTYVPMEKYLHDMGRWTTDTRVDIGWKRANCFIGGVFGMFHLKQESYIVGQVLYENRVHLDQVYKLVANGESMVEFGVVNVMNESGSYEPQTVRRLFGCSDAKPLNWVKRRKRSNEEYFGGLDIQSETNPQKKKTIVERVANNVLIRIMVSVFLLVLIYRLVGTRFVTKLRQKLFNQLF